MEDEMEYEWNPDWKPPVKNHEYTVEQLYHFTCGECKNWWSYASTEYNGEIPRGIEMNCPHCGHKADFEQKEN